MPERSFKGLPTVKKFVARLTKSGRLSTYYQRYHTNPFKKDRVPSDARKGKSVITDNELANQYGKALKFGVKSDKGLMFKDWITTLRVTNGSIGGVHTIDKILSKIKSVDDIKTFSSDILNPIVDKGLFSEKELSNNLSLLKEIGMFFNKSKPEYTESLIDGLKNNAGNMSDSVVGSLLASFSNYEQVDSAISSKSKSEAYTFDNLKYDNILLARNPLFHIMNYCKHGLFSNIKHLTNSFYGYNNNLKFLQNNSKLDEYTKNLFNYYIDKLNTNININDDLFLYTFVELNLDVAVLVAKDKLNLTLPFIFSPILEVSKEFDVLNDFKFIKDVNVNNFLPYDLLESKIIMEKNSKTIFLFMKHKISNINIKFIHIPDIDIYNDIFKYIQTKNDDTIASTYIKDKIDYIRDNLNNTLDKDTYLIVNSL